MAVREPIGKEQQQAREEARLGETEQETYRHEAVRPSAKGGCARKQAPRHHDAGDPETRAHLFQNDVARHFEQEIAPEKHTGGKSERRGIKTKILVHGKRGEAHIDAVEVAEEIARSGNRQHAPIHLPHGRPLDGRDHCFPPQVVSSFAGRMSEAKSAAAAIVWLLPEVASLIRAAIYLLYSDAGDARWTGRQSVPTRKHR